MSADQSFITAGKPNRNGTAPFASPQNPAQTSQNNPFMLQDSHLLCKIFILVV